MSLLSFEITIPDANSIQPKMVIAATNGQYAGVTDVTLHEEGQELIDLGYRLKGFPANTIHVEEIEFGFTKKYRESFEEIQKIAPNLQPNKAYVNLKFNSYEYTTDKILVFVSLQENEQYWSLSNNLSKGLRISGESKFVMRFRSEKIKKFASELIELGERKKGKIILTGLDAGKI